MKDILNQKIITAGSYTLTLNNVIYFTIFIVIVFGLLMGIKKIIYRTKRLDVAKKFSINKLLRYIIIIISFIIALQILGFNISVLLAGSAALLVGIGFGLQNLFSDFISGIILLLDRTLKVGDIIEVNGSIYKVLEINFRTTSVLGRNENYVIMPNSELTKNSVLSWTHSDISSRFKIELGVDYSSDVLLVMQVLLDVVKTNTKILKSPEPFVRFEDYGESALMFSVYFFSDEIFRVEQIKSDIRIEIFKALRANSIQIPFPQRDIHIKNDIISNKSI